MFANALFVGYKKYACKSVFPKKKLIQKIKTSVDAKPYLVENCFTGKGSSLSNENLAANIKLNQIFCHLKNLLVVFNDSYSRNKL